MEKLKKAWRFLTSPEMLSYLVFGVLTTLINILLAGLLYDALHWNLYVANTLAWVASVAFAFITNKLFVFQSKSFEPSVLMHESISFLGARLFSLGVDTLGMGLLVQLFHWNFWLSKILMNVIVVVLNYIFSKLLIFNQKK
ncbi:GtrA family protein [Clostridium minihomine]|uniref:GtrA family protein n=1 Tax=Clostridium minihomine TaxID=2045012 RepID=UPI000C77989C|nr:GtrA family protein [Clostridium minihomine]